MERAAGAPLATRTSSSGQARTARGAGDAGARVAGPNDPVLLNVAAQLTGYWADSADSWVLGHPPSARTRLHRAAHAGLIAALEAMRSGRSAAEIHSIAQVSGANAYSHHSGHGIGASQHEEPRLIAGNSRRLRGGMVTNLEPGAYDPGLGGVRAECLALVTHDGAGAMVAAQAHPESSGPRPHTTRATRLGSLCCQTPGDAARRTTGWTECSHPLRIGPWRQLADWVVSAFAVSLTSACAASQSRHTVRRADRHSGTRARVRQPRMPARRRRRHPPRLRHQALDSVPTLLSWPAALTADGAGPVY
jgi:Metallopeptidase family M24